jgi:hypothetical protein
MQKRQTAERGASLRAKRPQISQSDALRSEGQHLLHSAPFGIAACGVRLTHIEVCSALC